MINKTLFFDLETQNTFEELKMHNKRDKDPSKLQLAIAGVLYEEDGIEKHKFFGENQTYDLLKTINQANLIVGHNLLMFDYKVIQPYFNENITHSLYDKTFDILIKLLPYTDNCWTALDNLAQLNLGMNKPHSGILIPKMWRDGKFKEVEEYLLNDLRMTKGIYEYIKKNKKIKYTHKEYGTIIGDREVIVKW
ncbi:MAG: hypothetical protein PHP08_00035 [Candidatus Dojkabacteria bacterium]|nr:hypothetical protein [Candidatus Dojkabacteria bacterium]